MRILKSELTQHSCSSTFSYSFLEQLDEFHLLVYIYLNERSYPDANSKERMIYQRRDQRVPSKSSSLHQNFPISFFLFFLFDWWCTTGGVRNPMNSFFFRKNDLVKIPSRTAMLLYFMLQYKPLSKITFKLYTTFFLGKKKRKQLLKFSWGVQFKTWYTRIL